MSLETGNVFTGKSYTGDGQVMTFSSQRQVKSQVIVLHSFRIKIWLCINLLKTIYISSWLHSHIVNICNVFLSVRVGESMGIIFIFYPYPFSHSHLTKIVLNFKKYAWMDLNCTFSLSHKSKKPTSSQVMAHQKQSSSQVKSQVI